MMKAKLTGARVLHMQLMGGQARVLFMETTDMVQKCADIHNATPVCTAALGRLMTGTAMLGVMMKGDDDSVTVTIKGGGPMGTLVEVANPGAVKACADNPQVEMPLRDDGKLNVGGAVGHDGRMSVVKDLGRASPTLASANWSAASWLLTSPTTSPYPSSSPPW